MKYLRASDSSISLRLSEWELCWDREGDGERVKIILEIRHSRADAYGEIISRLLYLGLK